MKFLRLLLLPALLALLALGVPAVAAEPHGPDAEESAAPAVEVANRRITVFRAPFLGIEPEQRAQRSEALLRELIDRAGPGVVSIKEETQAHVLLLDGQLALVLTPGDVDAISGQTLAQASAAARTELLRVLAETREARDLKHVLRASGHTLLASAGALLLLVLLWRLRRWASLRLAAGVQRRAAALRVADTELLSAERLLPLANGLTRLLLGLAAAVLAYQWLSFVLRQFPYTRPWGEQLTAFLLGSAGHMGRAVLGALPDLFIAVSIFFIARAVIAMFSPFFRRVAEGERSGGWLDADTAQPTRRLFNAGVWVFAVVMAYPYLPGSNSEAFKGMSVLLGLMLSLGGASLIGQAASGLVLMYSRTLRVGEFVRIHDDEGTVIAMSAFTTRIRSATGVELTLPNALVLGTVTRNHSRAVAGAGCLVEARIGVAYSVPWRQVELMLEQAALRTPGIQPTPRPHVLQTALTPTHAEYCVVCHALAEAGSRARVTSSLHAHVQDLFREQGLSITAPQLIDEASQARVVPAGLGP